MLHCTFHATQGVVVLFLKLFLLSLLESDSNTCAFNGMLQASVNIRF